ncbi:MAG TPA: hypothetical protein ENG74_01120 [Thermoplasmatales archaeon]|nr:hypothetical protein [Thermoplasmatales archaeon]
MTLSSKIIEVQHRIGLSTDPKPSGMAPGSTIYERDTGRMMMTYDGTHWVEKFNPGVPIKGYQASNETYQFLRLCSCYGSLVISTEESVQVSAGRDYYYHDVLAPLGASASQDYLLTTPNSDLKIYFDLTVIFGDGAGSLEVYEGGDRVGSTLQTIVNRNRNSSNDSMVTIHKGQSGGTSDGTKIYWKRTGKDGGNTKFDVGGTVGVAKYTILKKNTKYIVRLTDKSAADNNISLSMRLIEHEDVL